MCFFKLSFILYVLKELHKSNLLIYYYIKSHSMSNMDVKMPNMHLVSCRGNSSESTLMSQATLLGPILKLVSS